MLCETAISFGAAQAVDAQPTDSPVEPGTRYTIPSHVVLALEELFANSDQPPANIESISVTYRPVFVRTHLFFQGGRMGSVTRPGRIYTNLAEDVFFDLNSHVLHEFYHVVQQWDREDMSVIGYVLSARRREREASDFARDSLREYQQLLDKYGE